MGKPRGRAIDYLVAAYRAGRGCTPVTLKRVSESMGVRAPTAHKVLMRLVECGYMVKTGRGEFALTEAGVELAERVIRSHRILETFLMVVLKCSAEEACEYASKLDRHAPPELINRMCEALGHPSVCPHGKPIPRGDCH